MSLAHRLRIRNAANTADLLVATSVRGGTNPWIKGPPKGDGASFDQITGKATSGKYTLQVVDGITTGTSRLFTSLLEDGNGRPQLARLRAYLDSSEDDFATTNSLIAGYLDLHELSDDITWDITILDVNALEHTLTAFAPHIVDGKLEKLQDYLTRWPNRGCIFGGPIRTPASQAAPRKFGNIADLNGWLFTTASDDKSTLLFKSGYESPSYQPKKSLSDVADRANAAAAPYFDATGSNVQQFAEFDSNAGAVNGYTGVIVQVGAQSGFTDGDDEYYCAGANLSFDPTTRGLTAFFLQTTKLGGRNNLRLTAFLPSKFLDTTIRARCFTAMPSDVSPIYWDGHPVDLITTLGEEAGFTYDTGHVETVRTALGADLRIAIRVPATQNQGDFIEAAVFGPYGISQRQNAAGDIEIFTTRVMNSALPSVTITNADVVRGSVKPFSLDPSTAIKSVTFTAEAWTQASIAAGTDLTNYPLDGVLVQPVTQQYVNDDPGAPETDTDQAFAIPGMPHRNGTWSLNWTNSTSFTDWAKTVAQEIFDRQGRGTITTEFVGIHGGTADGAQLGDEVIVALKQTPNHNKRLVDDPSVPGRCMQVVFADPSPNATELHLVDCGPNAQPVSPLPVLTIAATSRRVTSVTITNADTLNAASIAVRLRMATTTGSTADASAYAAVGYFAAGKVPTAAIPLPAVTAGLTVFVQGRSEQTGARPSNYSSPVHIALTGLVAPTASAAVTDLLDGSHATLNWTLDSSELSDVIDVSLRFTADMAAANVPVITLPAGSITYTLEHLAPGTAYTATIVMRDPTTGDTSDPVEIAFTTSGASVTLDPPTDANGFSGTQDPRYGFPQQDGVYGLAVAATEFPGFTEFVEQVETARNGGTYGDPVSVGTVPNVQGDWTLYENVAPNDGLRRILAAREVRDGANPSDYTNGVIVMPWTSQPLGLFSQTAGTGGIIRVSPTKSADGLSEIFNVVVGVKVDSVHAHYRTVPIDATGDIYNFSGAEDVAESPSLLIERPVDAAVSFSIPLPLRNLKVVGLLVPFVGVKDGPSVQFTVDAAPPAINAPIKVSRNGTTADLTIPVAFGPSDGPVQIQVYERLGTVETLLLTKTLAAPTTLDQTSDPVLGGRALPSGKDSLVWRDVITDVAGEPWNSGDALGNRDPLPNGSVALGNYRANPLFVIAFDPDTDSVIYTAHNAKTKTWNRAALDAAGSPVTYELGVTPLDDLSIEPALAVDEIRSGAHVDFVGGGTTVANVWSGDLHGQPKNPPTVKVDVEPVGDGDTVNVFLTPDTQVDEQLQLHYRLGITDTALEYFACVGASDQTPLAVTAGTRVGPSNFFMRVDLVGSPTALLAGIDLTHDNIDVQQAESIGVDSGMPSNWTNVQLSLLPLPLLESVALKFDPAAPNLLSALANAGARCGSVGVEFADNDAFSAPLTASGNVTDGNQIVLSVTLSDAQLGKQWHARWTPFSLSSLGGLVGNQSTAACAVPAVIGDPQVTVSESGSNTTLAISIDDKGRYIDQAWTDGTATGGLHAVLSDLGVSTEHSMSTHTLVGTVHTWTLIVAQDPLHPIGVNIYIHFIDGSVGLLLDTSVDSRKVAAVANATVANNGATATVTADWNTDTLIGSNCARYSLDGGSTFTTVTVSSILQSQFNITRTSAKQTAILQAKNALDGNWGDQSTVEIDAYGSESPSITAAYIRISDTSGEIVWACSAGTPSVSIDGGTPATPATSPIPITLDSHTHTYLFTASLLGGPPVSAPVSIPALSGSSGATGGFDNLDNQVYDQPTNKILFSWTYPDPSAAFDLYVSDDTGGSYTFRTRTSAGATQLIYTPTFKVLAPGAGSGTWDVGFYARAVVVGKTIGVQSDPLEATYHYV